MISPSFFFQNITRSSIFRFESIKNIFEPFSKNVPFASIFVIIEKVYFSAHSPSVSGA